MKRDLRTTILVEPAPAPTAPPSAWEAMTSPLPLQIPLFRLVRTGSRYAVHREGDARPGAWIPDDAALQEGWSEVFPEDEARSLLPLLRSRAMPGRTGASPTSADGKLIERARQCLGFRTVAELAVHLEIHESVLSRARHGTLPPAHRKTLEKIVKSKSARGSAPDTPARA